MVARDGVVAQQRLDALDDVGVGRLRAKELFALRRRQTDGEVEQLLDAFLPLGVHGPRRLPALRGRRSVG
jgi:hypothetical protein